MAFHLGIGVSKFGEDSYTAGALAAKTALDELGKDPAIAIVLASPVYEHGELLRGVASVFGSKPFVGCTTAGLISGTGPIEKAVGILLLQSDEIKFHPVKVTGIGADMRHAGKSFGEAVLWETGEHPAGAFIFSDALAGNGTEMVRGVFEILGANFPLVGGAAADDMQFRKTIQYYNQEILTDAIVGIAVSGDASFVSGAEHGWRPIGQEHVATKAEGTVLYEIDGEPAFSIYEKYLESRSEDFKKPLSLAAVTYPLGMKTEGDFYMIRVPLAVKDDGSIVCGAEVVDGSTIRLMVGDADAALQAVEKKTNEIFAKSATTEPKLAFLSGCVARKILLGERLPEEIQRLGKILGPQTTLFGFYSYGQIAPIAEEKNVNINTCDPGFYEQSLSVAILTETA